MVEPNKDSLPPECRPDIGPSVMDVDWKAFAEWLLSHETGGAWLPGGGQEIDIRLVLDRRTEEDASGDVLAAALEAWERSKGEER